MLVHIPIILTIFCIFLSFIVTPYFVYPAVVLVISTLFRIVPGETTRDKEYIQERYGKDLELYRSRRQLFALFVYTFSATIFYFISTANFPLCKTPEAWGIVISFLVTAAGTIVISFKLANGTIAKSLLPKDVHEIVRPRYDYW